MTTRRVKTGDERDRPMAESGERFERYVREAMQDAKVPSIQELVRLSRVTPGTIYNWFRGQSRPRPTSLDRMAFVLGRSTVQLEAAWDGREPPVGRFLTDAELAAVVEQALRKVLAERQTE